MSLREMYILFRGSRTCFVVIRSEIFHHSRTLFLFPQPQHALLEKGSDMCNDWKEAHDAAMEELKEKITINYKQYIDMISVSKENIFYIIILNNFVSLKTQEFI